MKYLNFIHIEVQKWLLQQIEKNYSVSDSTNSSTGLKSPPCTWLKVAKIDYTVATHQAHFPSLYLSNYSHN